jgi:tRNA nucleotidyltransferase (CCA-adding enzyme)
LQDRPYEPATRLPPLLAAARTIDTATAAQAAMSRGKQGPEIGAAVHNARVAAVQAALG